MPNFSAPTAAMALIQGTADEKFKDHMPECYKNGAQKIEFPKEEDKMIQFKDIEKQMELPFVIYADFECIITQTEDDSTTNTKKVSKHEASGYTFTTKSPFYESKTVSYRGPDAGGKFLRDILKEEKRVMQLINDANKEIIMTPADERQFQSASECHICEEPFTNKDTEWVEEGGYFRKGERVRDHCHFTGKFRGAAHDGCNLRYRKVDKIPVFFTI